MAVSGLPKHYIINKENEQSINVNDYKFGDVLIFCDDKTKTEDRNHFKTSYIKLVDWVDNQNELKYLIEAPNGLLAIPLSISSKLKTLNELNFYSKKFIELKKYTKIFKALELETDAHASLLNIFTSDRSIHESRRLFYFFVDPDEPNMNLNKPVNGVFIWHHNDKNLDVDKDARFIQVTPSLGDVHIGEYAKL
jgi:hypothetical protein